MRAAIYARVSSAAQRDAHTIESQLRVLRAFVKSQRWQLVGEYIDDGRSAKTGQLEHRDGFARLVRDAAAGAFDLLVVVDVDRLTRTSDMRERAEILGPFQRAGIRIVTPSGGELDLRTMLGELYVTMQALVASEENRKRAERIKAGKVRAIAEGRKPAGPTPFGWSYDRPRGEWSIHEPAAALVRELFRRVARGESCMQVADDLVARDVKPAPRTGWTRAAVYRIITRRTVLGEWCADKRQRAMVAVPRLITDAEWQATSDALLGHKKRGLKRTRHVYLLEGLAVCGLCGAPIWIRSSTGGRNGYRHPAAYVCKRRRETQQCYANIVRCADADAKVWAVIEKTLKSPTLAADLHRRMVAREANRRGWEDDVDAYRKRLAKLQSIESAVLARFRRGTISEAAFDRELAELGKERAAVAGQLERAETAAKARDLPQASASDIAARLRTLGASRAPEARQRVARTLITAGGVTLGLDDRIPVVLDIDDPTGDMSQIDIVKSADYRRQHDAITPPLLRLRLVA